MKSLKVSICAIFLMVIAGCAVGTKFNWQDTEQIKNGMTKSEVISILGKPYSQSQSGNRSVLIWSYARPFGSANAVAYKFVDNKVVGQTSVGK